MVLENPQARIELEADMSKAIKLLSTSIGIKPYTDGYQVNRDEVLLEGGLVAAIMQTAKGKKLMSRSIELLDPEKRWALIPVMLARVLQANPSEQSAEDKDVEERLMKTITIFIKQTLNHQEMISRTGQEEAKPFTVKLLGNLRLCLRSVMVSQMEETQLRNALLTSRARAEVLQNIVQVGDKICGDVESELSSEWTLIREAFMSMLDVKNT